MNLSNNYWKPGFWAVLLLLPCVALTGCGSSRRVPVEGNFSLDNKPVATGTITFAPDQTSTGGNELPMVKTDIKDGKYAFTASNGPMPGKYRVYASVKQKTGKQIPTEEGGADMRDEEIELMKHFNNEIHTIEVKDSDNKFDFTAKAGGIDDTKSSKPRKGD